MSVDGYIAGENGGVGWLSGDGSQPHAPGSYPAFYETVDTVVMGWTTYRQIVTELSPKVWPYEGCQCHVATHRNESNRDGICFWKGEPSELVDNLKKGFGRDI